MPSDPMPLPGLSSSQMAHSPASFSKLHYCPAHPCPCCQKSVCIWPVQDGIVFTWRCVSVSVSSKFTPYLVPFTEGAFRSPSMTLLLWVYLLHLSLRHIPHLSRPQFLYPLFSLLAHHPPSFHIGPHLLTMIRSSGCFTSSMAAVTSASTQSALRSSLVTVWALPHPPITTAGHSCGHYTERDTDTSRIQPLPKVMLVTNRP